MTLFAAPFISKLVLGTTLFISILPVWFTIYDAPLENHDFVLPVVDNIHDYSFPPFHGFHNFSRDGPRIQFHAGPSRNDLRQQRELFLKEPFAGMTRCGDQGQAYAAAWLSTTQQFIQNEFFPDEVKRVYILEAASFNAFRGAKGRVYQTRDMLDFFVHHQSKLVPPNALGTRAGLQALRKMESEYKRHHFNNPTGHVNGQVLVVTIFHPHGGEEKPNRKLSVHGMLLNLTVMSLANIFPNIVVSVCTKEAYKYVTEESGLNEYLYDVQYLPELEAKPKNLGIGTLVNTKHLLKKGIYPSTFEWIYYTECDSPLHLRDTNMLLHLTLELGDTTVIAPHRGHCWAVEEDFRSAPEVQQEFRHDFSRLKNKKVHVVPDLMNASCCFPCNIAKCSRGDDEFTSVYSQDVHLFRQYSSWPLVAGTGNEFKKKFETCQMTSGHRSYCNCSA